MLLIAYAVCCCFMLMCALLLLCCYYVCSPRPEEMLYSVCVCVCVYVHIVLYYHVVVSNWLFASAQEVVVFC